MSKEREALQNKIGFGWKAVKGGPSRQTICSKKRKKSGEQSTTRGRHEQQEEQEQCQNKKRHRVEKIHCRNPEPVEKASAKDDDNTIPQRRWTLRTKTLPTNKKGLNPSLLRLLRKLGDYKNYK